MGTGSKIGSGEQTERHSVDLLGAGNGTFGAATNFAVGGGGPVSITVGDFNEDGRQDLAVAKRNNDTVAILLGHGDGTFGTVTILPPEFNRFRWR